jgi:hypothetical protein
LSNPPPVITWYKDGEILDEEQMQWEGIIILTNGSLIISYTTQQHEGTYECVASNVGGTVSQAITLHVLGEFLSFGFCDLSITFIISLSHNCTDA